MAQFAGLLAAGGAPAAATAAGATGATTGAALAGPVGGGLASLVAGDPSKMMGAMGGLGQNKSKPNAVLNFLSPGSGGSFNAQEQLPQSQNQNQQSLVEQMLAKLQTKNDTQK